MKPVSNKADITSAMERTAVRSREIAIIGHDGRSRTLEIAFRSGGVYHYSGVSEEVHQALLKAPSQGIYFSQNIKEKYPYQKIS